MWDFDATYSIFVLGVPYIVPSIPQLCDNVNASTAIYSVVKIPRLDDDTDSSRIDDHTILEL